MNENSIEQLIVGENLILTLRDSLSNQDDYFRFILDYEEHYFESKSFIMDLDRNTLKGMADFIYQYLENN